MLSKRTGDSSRSWRNACRQFHFRQADSLGSACGSVHVSAVRRPQKDVGNQSLCPKPRCPLTCEARSITIEPVQDPADAEPTLALSHTARMPRLDE